MTVGVLRSPGGRKTLAQLGITIKKRKPKERGDDNESHLSGDKKGKKPTKAQLAARVKELEAAAAKANNGTAAQKGGPRRSTPQAVRTTTIAAAGTVPQLARTLALVWRARVCVPLATALDCFRCVSTLFLRDDPYDNVDHGSTRFRVRWL